MQPGFLNLYKSTGWTSHDCVAKVRRLLQTKKVGHGGTLDPAASGVLPMAVGRATRLLQFLPQDKAYRAVIRFGLTTTTDDLEGDVLTAQVAPDLSHAAAIAPMSQFVGTFEQYPPRYSAVQVNGQRLYALARQGQDVELPMRTVTVHHITIDHWQPGDYPELTVTIACGAGTYIRSIAREWGYRLGVGATLAALERTWSSGFSLATSLSLPQVDKELHAGTLTLIPPAIALHHLPALTLSASDAKRWQQGQKIPYDTATTEMYAPIYRVVNPTQTFLGITGWVPAPEATHVILRPKVVFPLPA